VKARARYAFAVFGWAAFAVHVLNGCVGRPETAPCDALTLASMTAACASRVAVECEPEPSPCPAQDECFAALDARQAECLARKP
jgi:hypothetical protein